MPKYATLAPNYGQDTVRVLKRVKQSRGTIVANFYAVIGPDNATLLSATYATKDREGRTCRQRAMDGEDRKAAGIPKGGKSARGVMVLTKAGALMFWSLTELSVQGAAATDKQLRLGLKKLCETADEMKTFKGRIDVGSGTRESFNSWWSSWARPEDGEFKEGNLDSLADDMGISRDELRELIADTEEIQGLLDDMVENDEPLAEDPLEETSFELSEKVTRLLATVTSGEVAAAKEAYQDALRSQEVEDWPAIYEKEATSFGVAAAKLATTDKAQAVARYEEGVRVIEQRAAQKKELDGARARINSFFPQSMDLLEEYQKEAGDTIPMRLKHLGEELDTVREKAQVFAKAIDTGDWPGAQRMAGAVRKAVRALHTALLNYPFEDSLALAVSQATFSPTDEDVALLVDLGNQGVCAAMSLDWLGHGGSLAEAGDMKTGAVSMSHLKWQAVYELGDDLSELGDTGAKQVVQEETGLRSDKEVERDLRRLAQEIERLRGPIEEAERYEKGRSSRLQELRSDRKSELEYIANLREAARLLRAGETLPEDLDHYEGDDPDDLEERIPSVQESVESKERDIEGIEREIAERWELAKDAKELVAELEEAVRILQSERQALTSATRKKMKRVRDMRVVYDRLNSSWRHDLVEEKHMPDSAMKAYGLKPKKGTGSEKDLGRSVAANATAFMNEMLDRPVDDEEVRFSISVQLTRGGHAIAARIKGPEPGGTDVWDIELFDPNFGGFRFDDRKRAIAWFVHLATVNYASNPWRSLSRFEVESRGDGPTSGGLHGGDPSQDWTRDYRLATQYLPTVRKLRPAPKAALERLELLKAKIDRQVSGAPTKMDYQIARPQLDKLKRNVLWLASSGPEVFQYWEFLSLNLDPDNPKYDGIYTTFGKGLRLWEEGSVVDGREELRTAFAQFISLGV